MASPAGLAAGALAAASSHAWDALGSLAASLGITRAAIVATLSLWFSYTVLNTFMQWWYYRDHASTAREWKIQPERSSGLDHDVAQRWWLPMLRSKPGRAKETALFATLNLMSGGLFLGATVELILRGKSCMYWDLRDPFNTGAPLEGISTLRAWGYAVGACLWAAAHQTLLEYYWHRLMHTPAVYKAWHKHHHFYKSPEPFDDMQIHPMEGTLYYFILYSPVFLAPMHVGACLAYYSVMGLTGVLDHCGVKISVGGIYNTRDHDEHHRRFEVNYGFPVPIMDIVHGTFDGEYLGFKFAAAREPGVGRSTGAMFWVNVVLGGLVYAALLRWLVPAGCGIGAA